MSDVAGRRGAAAVLLVCLSAVACASPKGTAPRSAVASPAAAAAPPAAPSVPMRAPFGTADAMAALEASPLALQDDERSMLARTGFVISDRKRFPTFADGWLAVYKADLPLYVSADALLHAVHRSYDAILRDLEAWLLIPRLGTLLEGMRARLAGAEGQALPPRTRADADFFLGIAVSLLDRSRPQPVAGGDAAEMDRWVRRVVAATGVSSAPVFGTPREVDISQFKPRGHYDVPPDNPLEGLVERKHPGGFPGYFRAIAWLGRIDARIAVQRGRLALQLQRRELDLACGLRSLMGAPEAAAWQELEATMNSFVGERDAMGPADVDRLLSDLGIAGVADLATVPDAKVLDAIARGHYGEQRIQGDLAGGGDQQPMPLPRSFSFTGQRYVVDSHVLSDLVYDRVTPPPKKPERLMPNPLDVAFAVFHNDDARALLADDIDRYGYGPTLEHARDAVDARGDSFWSSSLYNTWLGAIRALSPAGAAPSSPLVTGEAWGRRMLNAQLASWAELRHDAILYAKQSYTGGALCFFPDAYVDPYPAFYERLAAFADRGKAAVAGLDAHGAEDALRRVGAFFDHLSSAARRLERIAEAQRRGERPSADDLAFVNAALVEGPRGLSCGPPPPRNVHGWYIDLFYGGDALYGKPTIADVHTQPDDAYGNRVGNVLHVGTASPRLFVVNVDGGRSFVGLVSDYSETITGHFQRLTDGDWQAGVATKSPDDVPWMRDLVVR